LAARDRLRFSGGRHQIFHQFEASGLRRVEFQALKWMNADVIGMAFISVSRDGEFNVDSGGEAFDALRLAMATTGSACILSV
jgi:hypothetical protein